MHFFCGVAWAIFEFEAIHVFLNICKVGFQAKKTMYFLYEIVNYEFEKKKEHKGSFNVKHSLFNSKKWLKYFCGIDFLILRIYYIYEIIRTMIEFKFGIR